MISIRSSYGHRFQSGGCDCCETCAHCGARYSFICLAEDEPHTHAYTAADGSQPDECRVNPRMVHGYPGERYCACDDSDGTGRVYGHLLTLVGAAGPCPDCEHDCNCLLCQ